MTMECKATLNPLESQALGQEIASSELPLVSAPLSRRTLKHQDAFLICSASGDIVVDEANEEGYYFDGTRFLSKLRLHVDGSLPVLLGSHVRDQNDCLNVTLTNSSSRPGLPANTLRIERRTFLFENTCYVSLELENYGCSSAEFDVTLDYAADYADIYEIRGAARTHHGTLQEPMLGEAQVNLGYMGLDKEERTTCLSLSPNPQALSASTAGYRIHIQRKERFVIVATISCQRSGRRGREPLSIQSARKRIEDRQTRDALSAVTVRSSNGQFTEWFNRSIFDLNLMASDLPTGLYPYAGVPWFNTPFGRDGIVTALECLWMKPDVARGVLAYLAETQATEFIAEEDAEPGKILHETRNSEMAALKEMPFGRYYGSVDATPLFVLLAGAYYERTADLAFIRSLWPSVQAALSWMRLYGDMDGDGFIEYKRQSPNGLIHQGWKDSDDAIFHADGTPAEGALALCEVQAYSYGALRAGAILAEHLGHFSDSAALTEQAEQLHQRFNDAFWCDELSIYGLALDGNKQLCRVRSSNAGQCLFSGIATPDRARRIADTLLSKDCYSGWGIRTIASTSARYNPMSYHNGSVWPHDNGLIALGMARYGLTEHVGRLFEGIFASATYFDRYRLPELFCGFPREEGAAPVLYPVACAPQSWSAASIFLLIQACLGLKVDGISGQITLTHPILPESLKDLEIGNLSVGGVVLGFEVGGRGRDVLVRPTAELRGCSILRY